MKHMTRVAVAGTAAGVGVAFLLVGCGADAGRGVGDAGVNKDKVSQILPNQGQIGQLSGQANIISFPDQFANVAFRCNGVDGVYSTTRAAAPVIVPNDPQCKGTVGP